MKLCRDRARAHQLCWTDALDAATGLQCCPGCQELKKELNQLKTLVQQQQQEFQKFLNFNNPSSPVPLYPHNQALQQEVASVQTVDSLLKDKQASQSHQDPQDSVATPTEPLVVQKTVDKNQQSSVISHETPSCTDYFDATLALILS
jgi:hypothetical protein